MPSATIRNAQRAPARVVDVASSMGSNIALARKRRRLRLADVAAKAGITIPTLRAVEAGNVGTSVGAYIAVLWALGLEDGLLPVATLEFDPEGQLRERAALRSTLHLEALLEAAQRLEALAPGDPVPAVLQRLQSHVEAGTSMGGARPKNVVVDDEGLWLAKFPARGDRWNNAAVEAALLFIARQCDIRVPTYRIERVGTASVLLLRRFDRERLAGHPTQYSRARMVSALTVLDAEETHDRQRWSYLLLGDELQRWSSRAAHDRAELFRRMVFNALVTNNDDHPRNHAFVAHSAEWRLSPAYDLTPAPLHADERDLAMICGSVAGRRATRANLLSGCLRFGLTADEAVQTIDRLRSIVTTTWESAILSHGGTRADCEAVRPAFEIPGFDAL
ncbi:type II toxin-antitoxin system HipA family toxin [Gemmatimonas sp.]|jgi:serine/threonine-protein kinase HipA|uniref:type II toxin-antitoxin system HipA family toxin n=1 Tax=Gemmatimonas sp. TaxID=1962908 RepID=UPI0037C07953